MNPKKFTMLVCATLIISTCALVMLMYRSDPSESTDLVAKYNKNTQNFNRITSTTVITEIQKEEENVYQPGLHPPTPTPGPTPTPPPPGPTPSGGITWLDALTMAHRAMGHNDMTYVCGGNPKLIFARSVRPDCSGYVGFALYLYGAISRTTDITSATVGNLSILEQVNVDVYTELQAGDILRYEGHVEVFSSYGSTSFQVYNWGGHYSAQDQYNDENYKNHTLADCTLDVTSGKSNSNLSNIKQVYRIKAGVGGTLPQIN